MGPSKSTHFYHRAKYPLAIISKILKYLKEKLLIVYNIECTMEIMVICSSLGLKFKDRNARFCVPVFYTYSHNHLYQIQFHSNNIEEISIKDVETLKYVFSGMNILAPIVRYMSPFRCHLYIEAYLCQLDEDKYLNIGTFILSNYTQASEILEQETAVLKSLEYQGITAASIKE